MKNIFLLFSVVSFQLIIAQPPPKEINTNEENLVYSTAGIEVKPEYPGGIEVFYKHVAINYRVPTHKDFSGGRVIVSFVVEKDGSLSDVKVLKDAGFGTAEEAIRVVKSAKRWQPAEQNGKKVRCKYMLPISLASP